MSNIIIQACDIKLSFPPEMANLALAFLRMALHEITPEYYVGLVSATLPGDVGAMKTTLEVVTKCMGAPT